PAVARGLTLRSHLAALVFAVKVLVDPADGLVLAPNRGDLGIVQCGQQVEQRLAPRPKQRRGIAPIEERAYLLRDLIEDGLDVQPITLVGQRGEPRRERDELLEPG